MIRKRKIGQEEIMGFAIILVIIAVIALVFISLSNNKNQKQSLEDYETTSFLKAFLETTTSCEKNGNFIPIKDLIFECGRNNLCLDETPACEVLNETSSEIIDIWEVGNLNPVKGYELIIGIDDEILVEIKKGNETESYKGSAQDYTKSGYDAEIYIKFFT